MRYGYNSGSAGPNQVRPASLIYPNGRVIAYSYGTPGEMSDLLNRLDTIHDATSGTTDLASYTYLGLGAVIRIAYPEPGVWLDLWGGTSGVFNGLDRFNRIIDQRWQSGIAGTPSVEQNWSLDPNGNWSGFVTQASGTTNLNQTRTSNTVNEITAIPASTGRTWVTPGYDAAGNTTTMPRVVDPTQSYTAVYDAWNRRRASASRRDQWRPTAMMAGTGGSSK